MSAIGSEQGPNWAALRLHGPWREKNTPSACALSLMALHTKKTGAHMVAMGAPVPFQTAGAENTNCLFRILSKCLLSF
jgi:hypothetical protein